MMIHPLGQKVLIEIEEEKPKDGIVFTAEASASQNRGFVREIGSKVEEIKKGDRIIFERSSHKEMDIDGHKYFIISALDVLAVLFE